MPRENSSSNSQSQPESGLHLIADDLDRAAHLASLLHLLGDISASEAADIITLAQFIDQIFVFEDDIVLIHH